MATSLATEQAANSHLCNQLPLQGKPSIIAHQQLRCRATASPPTLCLQQLRLAIFSQDPHSQALSNRQSLLLHHSTKPGQLVLAIFSQATEQGLIKQQK